MDIINNTGLLLAPLAGRIGFPQHSLTLIVKGAFDLITGQKAVPAKEQLFPTGDELYPDDDEGDGSRFYESDFAYFKPRSDLLLSGKCHPPGGHEVQACKVTFGVGTRTKTLGVFGDRFWNQVTKTISEPIPFEQMELRYENSFGGQGFKKNPTGKGFGKVKDAEGTIKWPLPNVEDLKNLIGSPKSHPDPAGFGPISSLWPQRYSKLGTYKGDWLKERWPWYPVDFDWGYYNAAPDDMQVDGYLRGDETLYFENLHPAISSYHSQLPAIRPRLFIHRPEIRGDHRPVFFEPGLHLDTLWVDMEAEKLVLVWRGAIEVLSEDYDEIAHVFMITEKMDETQKAQAFYEGLFFQHIAPGEIESDEALSAEDALPETQEVDVEKEIAKAEAEIRDALTAAGIDPDWEIPEPTEADRQEEARLLTALGFEQETLEASLTRESVIQRVGKKEGFTGEDLSGLDLSGLDMQGADFGDAILDNVNLKESVLSSCSFKNTTLSKTDLSSADLKGADLSGADFTESILFRADLSGADIQDAVFDQADLKHAQLNDCNAENAGFCSADLTGASFANSRCRAADFAKSNLSGAGFTNAVLVEASVEDAIGIGVSMKGADLSGLHASGKTNFSKGNFQKVTGAYSIWENAILDEADFSMSHMEGANFASASLKSACFVGADLKYARLSKTNLSQARCMTMNLFEASLEKADLTKADFRLSNIYGAEFLDAVTEGAAFEGANLKMTKLSKNN